jgi:hypothetical protein
VAVAAIEEERIKGMDLFGDCNCWECKTLRGSSLIYKLSGGNTLTKWISARWVT